MERLGFSGMFIVFAVSLKGFESASLSPDFWTERYCTLQGLNFILWWSQVSYERHCPIVPMFPRKQSFIPLSSVRQYHCPSKQSGKH